MPKRIDQNQNIIVDALRKMGGTVAIISSVGKGIPDIILGYRGQNYLIEIKNGNKPPSGQKLTEAEEKFHSTWRGQVCIINSMANAIKLMDWISMGNVVANL